MNDFQMSFLASERRTSLTAAAQRERLARSAGTAGTTSHGRTTSRRWRMDGRALLTTLLARLA